MKHNKLTEAAEELKRRSLSRLLVDIDTRSRTHNQHVSLSQRGDKITGRSRILNRDFHVDHFMPELTPCFQVLLFGGSGVNEEEYYRRMSSVVPVFGPYLDELEKEWLDTPFCFTYITAPYDLAFQRMDADDTMQEKWSSHISEEVLPMLPDLPIYWIGYSGGFVLGWYALEDNHYSFGAGALGADQLFRDLCSPPWWDEPLRLYYNHQDPVYKTNESIIRELKADEEITCFRSPRQQGSHRLDDYLRNQSFSGLLRRAVRMMEDRKTQ